MQCYSIHFLIHKVDKIGTAAGVSTSSVTTYGGVDNGEEGSWTDIFTALPQTLGTMAVSLIKFVTPKSPAQKRVDNVRRPASQSVSQVFESTKYTTPPSLSNFNCT